MSDFLEIAPGVLIPESEIVFTSSRSGGPGGQHVNTTSTKISAAFDVAASPSLTDAQKALILTRLASRLTLDNVLRVTAQSTRSQATNKEQAVARLIELLSAALHTPKKRRRTRPTLASKERRLDSKKLRSGLKSSRKRISDE